MGSAKDYLTEGGTAQIAMHEGIPISVDLPASLVLAITNAIRGEGRHEHRRPEAGDPGDWGGGHVPLFVEEGERIKVDTRTGEYMERVKV